MRRGLYCTSAKEGTWQPFPHSPILDTRRQTQERQTKEHLASNSRERERDENPKAHLGYHPEAGPEQTGVEDLRAFMPEGIAGSK